MNKENFSKDSVKSKREYRTEKSTLFCCHGSKQIHIVVENNETDHLRRLASVKQLGCLSLFDERGEGGGGECCFFYFILGLSILLSLGQCSLPSLNLFGDSNNFILLCKRFKSTRNGTANTSSRAKVIRS